MSQESSTKARFFAFSGVALAGILLLGILALYRASPPASLLEAQAKSTRALALLQKSESLYASTLPTALIRLKSKLATPQATATLLESATPTIKESWGEYLDLRPQRDETIEAATWQILDSLQRLELILEILHSQSPARLQSLSLPRALETLQRAHEPLRALLEKERVELERITTALEAIPSKNRTILTLTLALLLSLALILFWLAQKSLKRSFSELKKANGALKDLAIKDGLSGVYNRRFFDIIFPRELEKAAQNQGALTFIMIDIDCFKLYNDTYGHGAGDEVLRRVAQALDRTIDRGGDYFFRMGGEEFGALVLGLDEEHSLALCEKMLRSVERLKIPHEKNTAATHVTISLGAACLIPLPQTQASQIMEEADGALYKAKQWGRNQAAILSRHESNADGEKAEESNSSIDRHLPIQRV